MVTCPCSGLRGSGVILRSCPITQVGRGGMPKPQRKQDAKGPINSSVSSPPPAIFDRHQTSRDSNVPGIRVWGCPISCPIFDIYSFCLFFEQSLFKLLLTHDLLNGPPKASITQYFTSNYYGVYSRRFYTNKRRLRQLTQSPGFNPNRSRQPKFQAHGLCGLP
jgi:hypothetical protein